MKFAVEMSSDKLAGYAKVHVAGCKDLVDPEPVEADPTQAAIDEAVRLMTGWDEDSFTLSPCAKKKLVSAPVRPCTCGGADYVSCLCGLTPHEWTEFAKTHPQVDPAVWLPNGRN